MGIVLVVLIAIVLLFVLGGAVLGLALNLVWWALLGLLIGALARLVLPGSQRIGWLATALFGVGGALLGGIIANAVGVGDILQFVIAVLVSAGLIAL
ncbi:MAG TPA: hypothetical protein VHK22_05945, partial [Gaiellaceae bacterium]|nr:hypothetical protein [Gaiellaceae bacterium]